jgi:hypothetical protein
MPAASLRSSWLTSSPRSQVRLPSGPSKRRSRPRPGGPEPASSAAPRHRPLRGQAGGAVQRAGIQQVVAQGLRHGGGQRALARCGGAVDGDHRDVRGAACATRTGPRSSREGLGHAARVEDALRAVPGGQRVEGRQRQAHRHAVVVVGVHAGAGPAGAGGVTSMKSAPSTLAPTLRSSVAIAAMRSVSFTRQLAMPLSGWCRRRTGPSRPASSRRRGCGCSPA